MSMKLVLLIVVLVALAWAALGGLIASLWEDLINVSASRRRMHEGGSRSVIKPR